MRVGLALLVAVSLAASPLAAAQRPISAEGAVRARPDATARAMRTLHWVNELQANLAQVALGRCTRRETLRYARRVFQDHQQVDVALLELAALLEVDLSPTVAEQQARNGQAAQIEERLMAAEASFDDAYLRVAEESHRGALRQLAQLRRDVDADEVRTLLARVLPLFEQHQALARRLRTAEPV